MGRAFAVPPREEKVNFKVGTSHPVLVFAEANGMMTAGLRSQKSRWLSYGLPSKGRPYSRLRVGIYLAEVHGIRV